MMTERRFVVGVPRDVVVAVAVQVRQQRVEREAGVVVDLVHQGLHHRRPLRHACTHTESGAPTPWGTGGRCPPPLSLMAGHRGHREQNIKQEIAKYFLS